MHRDEEKAAQQQGLSVEEYRHRRQKEMERRQEQEAVRERGITVEDYRRERQQEIERQRWDAVFQKYAKASHWPETNRASWPWLALSIGQVFSILGCIASPPVALIQLSATAELAKKAPESAAAGQLQLWIILMGIISFLLSLAMFFVFGRAKWVARLAECQRAIIYTLQRQVATEDNAGHEDKATDTGKDAIMSTDTKNPLTSVNPSCEEEFPCQSCGQNIPANSMECPHCGRSHEKEKI